MVYSFYTVKSNHKESIKRQRKGNKSVVVCRIRRLCVYSSHSNCGFCLLLWVLAEVIIIFKSYLINVRLTTVDGWSDMLFTNQNTCLYCGVQFCQLQNCTMRTTIYIKFSSILHMSDGLSKYVTMLPVSKVLANGWLL